MIKIIENGVAADLRITKTTSDLQQTTHEEIKIFSTFLDGRWRITSQVSNLLVCSSSPVTPAFSKLIHTNTEKVSIY